jgi:hypothetical protein
VDKDSTTSRGPGASSHSSDEHLAGQISKLNIADSRRKYHHNALWEEEKHFTWLVSLILSAELFLFTSDRIVYRTRLTVAIAIALLGTLISAVALIVLRKESSYFHHANKDFVEEFNLLFPQGRLSMTSSRGPNRNPLSLLVHFFRGSLGVRDAFQFIFVIFALTFAAILVVSVVLLTRHLN